MMRHIQYISFSPILWDRSFMKAITTVVLMAEKGRFFKKMRSMPQFLKNIQDQ